MCEMIVDWLWCELVSIIYFFFNIYFFQMFFQINFCFVLIFLSDLWLVYDYVIENDNFKNVFFCFRFIFCNEEYICIDIYV